MGAFRSSSNHPTDAWNTRMQETNQTKDSQSEPDRRFACPICKRVVNIAVEGSGKLPPFFPFCSERCKMIDLGAWFDADYRIPGKPDEESEEAIDPEPPQP